MSWNTAAWQDLGIIPLYVADWKTNTNRTMTSDLRVSERSCSELQKSTILTQMESWLSAGVVRFSPGNALAVGCGHLHVVPARVEVPGSKPRVTLDPGREINDSLDKGCVLLPSVASIAGILSEPGDWFLAKIDLRRGFHHMIASPCSRHRFIWKGDIFEFMRLPFGPRDGPAAFQRCTSAIGKFLKSIFQIRVAVYLNDLMIFAGTPSSISEKIESRFARLDVTSTKKRVQVLGHGL